MNVEILKTIFSLFVFFISVIYVLSLDTRTAGIVKKIPFSELLEPKKLLFMFIGYFIFIAAI